MNKTNKTPISVILTIIFAFSATTNFLVNKPIDAELFTLFISLKEPFLENQKT